MVLFIIQPSPRVISSNLNSFKDSKKFSNAYVDDFLDCLNVAHEQNLQILAENDLGDVFN